MKHSPSLDHEDNTVLVGSVGTFWTTPLATFADTQPDIEYRFIHAHPNRRLRLSLRSRFIALMNSLTRYPILT